MVPDKIDPLISEELSRLGLNPAATIPLAEEVSEYDLKQKPLLELPDTSAAVTAINDLMAKLTDKN